MARDDNALTVQGPDNGTGNPLSVQFASAYTQSVNLTQVGGTNVSSPLPVSVTFPTTQDVNVTKVGGTAVTSPLPVTNTPAGTQDVNLTKIAGNAVAAVATGVPGVGIVDSSLNSVVVKVGTTSANSLSTSVDGCSNSSSVAAANTANVITITNQTGQTVRISWITVSYLGANPAVNVVLADAGGARWVEICPAAQAQPLHFTFPNGGLRCAAGGNVTITLPAGGAGVQGNLSAGWHQY